MGNAVPVEYLLLFLGPDTVVLVQKVQKGTLGLFERCVGTRLQVAQIGKDALLEFLRVLHRSPERLKSEGETSDNVGAGDVKEVIPV